MVDWTAVEKAATMDNDSVEKRVAEMAVSKAVKKAGMSAVEMVEKKAAS